MIYRLEKTLSHVKYCIVEADSLKEAIKLAERESWEEDCPGEEMLERYDYREDEDAEFIDEAELNEVPYQLIP